MAVTDATVSFVQFMVVVERIAEEVKMRPSQVVAVVEAYIRHMAQVQAEAEFAKESAKTKQPVPKVAQ